MNLSVCHIYDTVTKTKPPPPTNNSELLGYIIMSFINSSLKYGHRDTQYSTVSTNDATAQSQFQSQPRPLAHQDPVPRRKPLPTANPELQGCSTKSFSNSSLGLDHQETQYSTLSIHDAIAKSQPRSPPQRLAVWGINWKAPAKMVGLLILGAAVPLGHHFYYQSLDGKRVSTETQIGIFKINNGNCDMGQPSQS